MNSTDTKTRLTVDLLRALPLFQALGDRDLQWILQKAWPVEIEAGETLFVEGDTDVHFFVLLDGKFKVTKQAAGGQEVLLATHDAPGEFTGEIPMLLDTPQIATAIAAEPSQLIRLDKESFCRLITYPSVSEQMMPILAKRIYVMQLALQQRQKLAALGTLAAGLAHELNNPAAAASRSAEQLRETLPALQPILLRAYNGRLSAEQYAHLDAYLTDALSRKPVPRLDPIAEDDLKDNISQWFAAHGLVPGWNTASSLAEVGIGPSWLDTFAARVAPEMLDDLLRWICASLEINSLLDLVGESSSRVSQLVRAAKGYSYMDQAPVQEVDVHDGLESTLTMLNYKLAGVTVTRCYTPDLPRIMGNGSELNQVWTNLIDNAVDAMDGSGNIRISTYTDDRYVVVEFADNGPGIPPEIQDRIFEPFFTTKSAGEGVGLGLDICYSIVVSRHQGDIRFESRPGHTRFLVWLPALLEA